MKYVVIILLISMIIMPVSISQKINDNECTDIQTGQILFAPLSSTETYLMDRNNNIIKMKRNNTAPILS